MAAPPVYTTPPRTVYLADSTSQLIAVPPAGFDWRAYADLQAQIGGLLSSLFAEADDTLTLSDYALQLADGAFDEAEAALRSLMSDLEAFQVQSDHLSGQSVPLTGSSYTRMITESFRDAAVRDDVSLFGSEDLSLKEPGSLRQSQVRRLSGLRWDIPIIGSSGGSCVDPPPVSAVMAGDSGQIYNVTLRFRGVVETCDYVLTGPAQGYWVPSGSPRGGSNRNVYRLDVSSPAQTYYLNYASALSVNALDYSQTVPIGTGATVTLTALTIDGMEAADPGYVIPGVAPTANHGQYLQMDVTDVQPLTGAAQDPTLGCPVRPPLEVGPRQTLRLRQEGAATAFSGLPGRPQSLGGSCSVDRLYGTPFDAPSSAPWSLSVASRSPLTGPSADNSLPAWVPSTYEGGACARLQVRLENPSPVSEARLRGALLPGGGLTSVLETVLAVSSRPDPTSLISVPLRALNSGWSGSPSLSAVGWQLTPGSSARYAQAPDRAGGSADRSLLVSGQAYAVLPVRGGSHYVLRFRPFCPYGNPSDPGLTSPGGAACPESARVSVISYASVSPTYGSDTPLDAEYFVEPYPHSGDRWDGAASYTRLVSVPPGARTVVLAIGTDPLAYPSEVGYSDVWLCDEAVTRPYGLPLPVPSASNLKGPSVPGGVPSVVADDSVESLDVDLGNLSGSLIATDVWVTLGQSGPTFASAGSAAARRKALTPCPPYALSLPLGVPSERASRDPLLLHAARYVGAGAAEWDASEQRLRAARPAGVVSRWPLLSRLGLWPDPSSRGGRRDAPPPLNGWKDSPRPRPQGDPSSLWPGLWAALTSLSKSRRAPLALPALALRGSAGTESPPDSASLYVYSLGLSSLSLRRTEYATSGLYVTRPLQEIDGGTDGEIRELGVLLDPPLPTLGGRVRLWVVPDQKRQIGTSEDSPQALLARAVPLDSRNPRASFHCTAESRPGLSPATSDVVDAWSQSTGLNLAHPAFAVPPALNTERVSGGLDPDQGATGLKLAYPPYVNREAVFRVNTAISSGSVYSPRRYNPNAVRPLAELTDSSATGENLYAVTGYRPLTLTLTLPNGRQILPDAQGPPTPGEVVFSGREVLTEADSVQSQVLPAATAAYTFRTPDSPAVSSLASISYARAFRTAQSPVAAGDNGASIRLWWHQSTDFNPASGGVLTTHDVEIPASEFQIDTHTGLVRVLMPPPHNWSAAYDQVVAEYFWVVGDVAPREVFPVPDISALYTPFVPYLVDDPSTVLGQPPVYKPTQPIFQGYKTTESLTSDPTFSHQDQYWVRSSSRGTGDKSDVDWNSAGRGTSYHSNITAPRTYWFGDAATEGVYQDMAYPGPGAANLSTWFSYNPDNHPSDYSNRTLYIKVEVYDNTYSSSAVLESYVFQTQPIQAGTAGLPCLATSKTGAGNLGASPPWWWPLSTAAAWPAFQSHLTSGTQVVYQWPASRMSGTDGAGWVVGATDTSTHGTVDSVTSFAAVRSDDPARPFGAQMPFKSDQKAGRKVRVSTYTNDGSNSGDGIMGFQTDVWWTTSTYTQGCVAPYSLDPITGQCKLPAVSGSPVGDGTGSGQTVKVPSDLADLLAGPISQSYPVTRNVTDYVGGTVPALRAANMDPLSPDYYPVFEYRIDPGGVVVFAEDFSTLGTYAGTDLEFTYDYLDVSPRLILEVLPEGESATDLPGPPGSTLRPATQTPEINSLAVVLNTR